MKKTVIAAMLVLTIAALAVNASALEVPTDTVTQNLNGAQQCIKTYTVPPETDPEALIEEPFETEGFFYTYSGMTKHENTFDDAKQFSDTVSLETEKDDLIDILALLQPVIPYDDGVYAGKLYLEHDTIKTEASGYESRSYAVSTVKEIENLDRNDTAYVPATALKDGLTLSLAGVEWRVQATSLVDEVLVPSLYTAVATYTGTAWYKAATGYITTAKYSGEISATGVSSVTYTLTYIGEAVSTPQHEATAGNETATANFASITPFAIGGAAVAGIIILILALQLARTKKALGARNPEECPGVEGEEVK